MTLALRLPALHRVIGFILRPGSDQTLRTGENDD
jgi:hypothetical protein